MSNYVIGQNALLLCYQLSLIHQFLIVMVRLELVSPICTKWRSWLIIIFFIYIILILPFCAINIILISISSPLNDYVIKVFTYFSIIVINPGFFDVCKTIAQTIYVQYCKISMQSTCVMLHKLSVIFLRHMIRVYVITWEMTMRIFWSNCLWKQW